MAEAAVAHKSEASSKPVKKAQNGAPEVVAEAGTPAFLGGAPATTTAPVYLQRQPSDPHPEDETQENIIQRMPQDPFPSNGDDDPNEDGDENPIVQPKLRVNTPQDAFEAEADRVASVVTAGPTLAAAPAQVSSVAPAIQRKCAACSGEHDGEGGCPTCRAKVQRKEAGPATPTPSFEAANVVASPGAGSPLAEHMRRRIEPALGQDLGGVRVHSDDRSREAASSINAKAFTHGNHIWLGPGQSADDVGLMAHEATHTVQQSRGGGAPALIQRAPSDHLHPEDGEGPRGRMHGEIAEEVGDEEPDPDAEKPEIDPAEKQARKGALEGPAKPDTDRPAAEAPKVDQAAAKVEAEADKPGEKIVDGEAGGGGDSTQGEGEAAEAQLGVVEQALAAAATMPEPPAPQPIAPPPPVAPVNKDGEPVSPDFETEARVQLLAGQIQATRQGAHAMRMKARQEKANAAILRGNIALIDQHVGEAETGLVEARGQVGYRRSVAEQADKALKTSEDKATKVAADAPGFESEAADAQGESGPMASEASATASENASNTPDDPDGAKDSAEAGGQMNSVSSDSAAMDQAAGATKARAVSLQQDAAAAKTKNAESKGLIEETKTAADQAETKITEMDGEAATARGQVDGVKEKPDEIEGEADRIDKEAEAVQGETSTQVLELAQLQKTYASDVSLITGSGTYLKKNEKEAESEAPQSPADQPPGREYQPKGYEGRRKVDLRGALFGAPELTEEQKKKQAEDQRKAEEKRRQGIASLEAKYGKNLDNLSGLDKAGIALGLMGDNLFSGISDFKWPDFSMASLGKALLGVFNPLGPLEGVLSGLSTVASGALNLFDMDQWAKDPLGNLLKSAADIATGITVILGSIVALLGVVMALAAAVIVVTLGWASPVMMPVISFCGSATITVGGWTISVGLLALYYQSLLFIKNLVDAMTAETAEELYIESEQMTEDTKQAGEITMQIGQAALSKMGGAGMMDEIGEVGAAGARGGSDAFKQAALSYGKQQTYDGLKDAFVEGMLGEDLGGLYGMAKMGHGLASGARARSKGGGDAGAAEGGATPKASDAQDAPASTDRTPDAPDAATQKAPETVPQAPPPPDMLPPRNAAEAPRQGGPGELPPPRADMDAPLPDRAEPKSIDEAGASPDAEGSAPKEGGTGDGANPAPEGVVPDASPAAKAPNVPKLDAPVDSSAAKSKAGSDTDGPLKAAEDPSKAASDAADADASTRPKDADTSDTRDPVQDAKLREQAAQKKGEDLSRDEKGAEAALAAETPSVPVQNPELVKLGFNETTPIGNGLEHASSPEMGISCRIGNMACGPGGDGINEGTPLSSDGETPDVEAALADGGGSTTSDGQGNGGGDGNGGDGGDGGDSGRQNAEGMREDQPSSDIDPTSDANSNATPDAEPTVAQDGAMSDAAPDSVPKLPAHERPLPAPDRPLPTPATKPSTDAGSPELTAAQALIQKGGKRPGEFRRKGLEARYQDYVASKQRKGEVPRDRAEWKVVSDYHTTTGPFGRGNAYNAARNAEGAYPHSEVNLESGKRVDSYRPPRKKRGETIEGEIVSRKDTDFDHSNAQKAMEDYLQEAVDKYSPGETINSPKYPKLEGQSLEGKIILEVPLRNATSARREYFESLAASMDPPVEIRYAKSPSDPADVVDPDAPD